MEGEVEDACPGWARVSLGGIWGKRVGGLPLAILFAPDEDFAVVAGGGEDVAVFGVGLWEGVLLGLVGADEAGSCAYP